jgi:hypothetical protein
MEFTSAVNRIIEAGYPYEIAGLVYYVFFLYMVRKRGGLSYSQRTRVLTIIAAIGLVGVVPFHYATNTAAVATILLLGVAALVSAFLDARY